MADDCTTGRPDDRTTLGIDLGTGKVALVVLAGDGRQLHAASAAHGAGTPAADGRAEQDARRILATAAQLVQAVPARLRQAVTRVGVTGQMHGVVLVDAAGAPLGPLITWQDRRVPAGFLAELAAATGHRLHAGYGCATLAWLARQAAIPAGAKAAATIQDLLVAQWCGRSRPVTEASDAASWGCFDPATGDWDRAALRAAGLPAGLLPEVMAWGSTAGRMTSAMAGHLGLPAGIPVLVAIGDNQASLRATLRDPASELAFTLGTGCQLSAVMPSAAALAAAAGHPGAEVRPYVAGSAALVAAPLCGGAAWSWLADTAAAWMADLGGVPPARADVLARLDRLGLAARDRLRVRTSLLGERHDPALTGAIEGLTLDRGSLGEVARAVARGIAAGARALLPPAAFAGRVRVLASGNALRRSELLRSMAAAEFGLPVELVEGDEEAARGAAMI